MKQLTCPHCGDTYPDFDVAHVCSRGPYAVKLKPQMNEQIKKLAGRALDASVPQTWTTLTAYDLNKFTEKFAELIVKECIQAVKNVGGYNEEYHMNAIKKYFGVEEQVNDSKELHTCPYREELHNDHETLCDCDEEQQHQCAMDI
jgi:hypothetical protein